MKNKLILMVALFWCGLAMAASIEQPLPNAAHEQEARAIFGQLKCVVCVGQSLADSDAMLAQQMRAQVRKMVGQGQTKEEILAFFSEHYGEEILLTPRFAWRNLALWFAPLLLLLIAGVALWRGTSHTQKDMP